MVSKIKSNEIKKKIFSYLGEKSKLSIIIYNKSLMKALNIDINDYMQFNNCILSIDKNGKGIITSTIDNNLILFEGEYFKKKRNGKGIQYYKGNKIFEGIYKKGKKWEGKIKEYKLIYENGRIRNYDNDNNLIYEGEYMNSLVKRKSQEYIYLYKEEFEGEYINGKFNGILKRYNDKGKLLFEGKYINGEKNGEAKEYDEKGNVLFEGEYKNDKKYNGIIRHFNNKGIITFEGEYTKGEKSGKVKCYKDHGDHSTLFYDGQFLKGEMNGQGKLYNDEGKLIFEGEFKEGKKYKGILKKYNDNGALIFEGEYLNGEKHGNKRKRI